MTTPRTRLPGNQLWQGDRGPAMSRYTLVLAASVVWMLLVLIGVALTFT